jgi:hypothetical protein
MFEISTLISYQRCIGSAVLCFWVMALAAAVQDAAGVHDKYFCLQNMSHIGVACMVVC